MERKQPMSELLGNVSRVSSGQTGRLVTRAWMCCFFTWTSSGKLQMSTGGRCNVIHVCHKSIQATQTRVPVQHSLARSMITSHPFWMSCTGCQCDNGSHTTYNSAKCWHRDLSSSFSQTQTTCQSCKWLHVDRSTQITRQLSTCCPANRQHIIHQPCLQLNRSS